MSIFNRQSNISRQTIIENSKHTPNTALELERIKAEEDDRAKRVKEAADLQGNGSGDNNPFGESGENGSIEGEKEGL